MIRSKKGYARFILPAGVILIIGLFFRIWATGLIITAMEPELEKALDNLNENIVCIPEASSENYEICITNMKEVIVNGNLKNSIAISTDSGDYCTINSGKYDFKKICSLNNLNKANQIYIEGIQTQKIIIEAGQITTYINNLQNLKKPIKTGFWIFKRIKYFPL